MKLLNPIMLSCLVVVILPIVLHLLNRSRYRQVQWGAMMFMQDSDQVQRTDPARWRQWGLLALRILLLGVIGFALARPILTSTPSADSTRLAVMIVIDATPSMGHPEVVETRLAIARRVASSILSQLQRGDQAGLVVLGQPQNRDVPLTSDLQDIASRIASLGLSLEPGNMNDGQRRAHVLLQQAENMPRKIYLIGDRDLENWAKLEKLEHDTSLTITSIPVGSTINDNISIDHLKINDQPVVHGGAFELEIQFYNHSNIQRLHIPVTIRTGDDQVDAFPINLPPRASVKVNRMLKSTRLGENLLSVSINSAGIPADDHRQIILSVIPPIQFEKLTSTTVLSTELLAGKVLFIDDITELTEDRVDELEDFVFSGGGVLLSPSATLDITHWNNLFDSEGEGLAPSPIAYLQNNISGTIGGTSIQFGACVNFASANVDNTFLSFSDGKPLMLQREYGKGRVICSAVSISDPEFAKSPEYASIIARATYYLGTAQFKNRNQPAKSLLEVTFPNSRDRAAFVSRPDGRTERINLKEDANNRTAIYSKTEIPGRYTISIPNTPRQEFVIYGQNPESNLHLLGDAQLAPIFLDAEITQASESEIRVKPQLPFRQQELSLNFLMAALAILGIEFFVSRRISGGIG